MGELRPRDPQPESKESSTGVERASALLFDQFLSGDFNIRRNSKNLLTEAGQLEPYKFSDEETKRKLSLTTNLYSLETRAEWESPDLSARLHFAPSTGWNNPFRRPSYEFFAQTTDKSTLLSLNSRDGAAPTIKFEHSRDGMALNYYRNTESNVISFTAQSGASLPLRFDLGHDFRRQQTRMGLNGYIAPHSQIGVGAAFGKRDYDLNFFLKVGAKSND